MKPAALSAMLTAAALLFFGATLQAGVGIGALHEPKVIPLAILEMACALVLLFAVRVLLVRRGWKIALLANAIAFAAIVVEIVIRTTLAGRHTASNHSPLFFPMAMSIRSATTFTTQACWG